MSIPTNSRLKIVFQILKVPKQLGTIRKRLGRTRSKPTEVVASKEGESVLYFEEALGILIALNVTAIH